MSFGLPQIDPETTGRVEMPVPLGRYLDAAYSQGEHDSVLGSINRMREISVADADQNSRMLSPEEATKTWGVGDLRFDQPVRESVAKVMNTRKREEISRFYFLEKGSNGLISLRSAAGLGAGMLASLLNPIDLGVMFIPFVGEEAAAAKITGTAGKILARRLITREALREVIPRAPVLAETVINASLGQALFEVPNLIASQQDQATYGLQNALLNIAAGSVLASSIHGAIHLFRRLTPETKLAMAKQALNDTLRDEPIRADRYVSIDEGAIRAATQFNSAMAEVKALKTLNMPAILAGIVEKVRQAEPLSDREKYLQIVGRQTEILQAAKGLKGEAREIAVKEVQRLGVEQEKLKNLYSGVPPTIEGLPVLDTRIAEFKKNLMEAVVAEEGELVALNKFNNALVQREKIIAMNESLDDATILARPDVQQRVMNAVDANIKAFVEQAKKEYDPEKQFSLLKQHEIDKQIAAGKILKPEEIEQHQKPPVSDESTEAQALSDVEDLKKELGLDKFAPKQVEPSVKSIETAIRCIDMKVL